MGHKFVIKGGQTPQSTTVLMDGKPLENLTSIGLVVDWHTSELNRIELEFVPDAIEIDVDTEVWLTDKIKQLVKEIEEKNG